MGQRVSRDKYDSFGDCSNDQLEGFFAYLDRHSHITSGVVRYTKYQDSYHQIQFDFHKYKARVSLSQKQRPAYQRTSLLKSSHIYGALVMIEPLGDKNNSGECFIYTGNYDQVSLLAEKLGLSDEIIVARSQ